MTTGHSSDVPTPSPGRGDNPLQARVAWYYFVSNLTQQEIADRLDTSRVRVNRLLAACRENDYLEITINSELGGCVALESALIERFGLRDAVVVPTPADAISVREAMAAGAASYLPTVIGDGMTIAVGWGRTITATVRALVPRAYQGTTVVGLQGGLAHCSQVNTFEVVSNLAECFEADQCFFAAPLFASSATARDVLLAQRPIRQAYELARESSLALITVGDMENSLVVNFGIDRHEQVAELREAGAVGEVLGCFIDAEGCAVDHPLNRRIVALTPTELAAMRHVVMVAGDPHRAPAIRAAIIGRITDVLITDRATAEVVLAS